jgi:septum formation protein
MQIPSPFPANLILASSSPRRAEILQTVGWPFEAVTAGIDETQKPAETPADYVQRLAAEKAEAVASTRATGLVLGADTTVVVNDNLLAQPTDDEDARRMLRLLSGNWHEVLTGVALINIGVGSAVDYETTRVRFTEMTDAEIDWYVSTGEANGKAGAYAIQGRAALFIEEIEGEYFNIVGLPIRRVYQMVLKLGPTNP